MDASAWRLGRLLSVATVMVAASLLVMGCGENDMAGLYGDGGAGVADVAGGDVVSAPLTVTARPAFHEHELARDPSLRVNPDDIVLVHLEAPSHEPHAEDSGSAGVDEIPYAIPQAIEWQLCALDQHGEGHRIQLVDERDGADVLALHARHPRDGEVDVDGCVSATVPAGHYTLRITHVAHFADDSAHPEADLLFLQPVAPGENVAKADQAALTAHYHVVEASCANCDLSGIDLRGHTLDYLNIHGATLDGADLRGAHIGTDDLRSWDHVDHDANHPTVSNQESFAVNLRDVTFAGAKLDGTTFLFADLADAVFDGADLTRTNFYDCQLRGASFSAATFDDTMWQDSDLCESTPGSAGLSVGDSAQTTLSGTVIPFELVAVEDWEHLDFDGATIVASDAMKDTSFDDLALGGATWRVTAGTDFSGTSWENTGARLGAGDEADLTACDFSNAVMRSLDLQGVDLTDAVLLGTDLSEADLTGATLSSVQGTYADFTNATLTRAVFDGGLSANLYGAIFIGANLQQAHLSNADLSYADLYGATTDLTDAMLVAANLTSAHLAFTKLVGVNAHGATLDGANLIGADLTDAEFSPDGNRSANLDDAYLCGATLLRTDFSGATLTGAFVPAEDATVPDPDGNDLVCRAVVTSDAITDDTTTCPSGLRPRAGEQCAGDDWTAPAPPPAPCCTPLPHKWCPRRARAGQACTDRCHCRSYHCETTGVCAP